MLETTYNALKSILKADPSIPVSERNEMLAKLRSGPAKPSATATAPSEPRLLRRAEVARRLGCSLRLVDRLSRDGVLPKRRLPNRTRASGILEADLANLLAAQPPIK